MNYDILGSDYSLSSGKGMAHNSPISPFWNGGLTFLNNSASAKASALGLDSSFAAYFADPSDDGFYNKPTGEAANGIQINPSVSDPAGDGIESFYNSASYDSPATPQRLQYIDAPLAEMYGMDASTAYNEALSNTAYQRKVKDLQAAGLNPVLGISGSGAANFYGSPAASSGGGYGSSGSGKSTASLSGTAQKLSYFLPTLVNGVVNLAVSLSPAGKTNPFAGYGYGMVAQNLTSGLLGAVRNLT